MGCEELAQGANSFAPCLDEVNRRGSRQVAYVGAALTTVDVDAGES